MAEDATSLVCVIGSDHGAPRGARITRRPPSLLSPLLAFFAALLTLFLSALAARLALFPTDFAAELALFPTLLAAHLAFFSAHLAFFAALLTLFPPLRVNLLECHVILPASGETLARHACVCATA